MALSIIASGVGTPGAPPSSAAITAPLSIGNVIFACLMTNTGQSAATTSALSVSDNINAGAYTLIGQFAMPDGHTVLSCFMKVMNTVAPGGITVSTSALGTNFGILSILAVGGWAGSPALDSSIGNWTASSTEITASSAQFITSPGVSVTYGSQATTAIASTPQTTAQPNEIVLALEYVGTSLSGVSAGWSTIDTSYLTSFYQLTPTPGTTVTFSADATTSDWGTMLIGIYDMPAGGAVLATQAGAIASASANYAPWAVSAGAKASVSVGGTFSANAGAIASVPQAALLNWASVVLAAPLYPGLGGALDDYLWTWPVPGPLPQAGETLYYDPTNMSIAANGEITATSNHFSALMGFYDALGTWHEALYTITPTLVAYGPTSASLTATLSGGAQPLNVQAAALASALTNLSTQILAAASAGDVASVTATLSSAAMLASQASSLATASAGLTTNFDLGTLAAAISKAAAVLTNGIKVNASAASIATLTAALSTSFALKTSASANASATPTLTNVAAAALASLSADIASIAAYLSSAIKIGSQASSIAALTPAMTGSKPLATLAGGLSSTSAAMRTGAGWIASANAIASASPSLRAQTQFSTLAAGLASASPTITGLPKLTVPLLLSHQIPGIYQPGSEPVGEFPLPVGEKSAYGIDWSYWIAFLWQPGYSAALGYVVRPFPWTGYEYICTQAGQTGAVPPVWPQELGQYVVDGSVIWQAQALSSASLQTGVESAAYACSPAGLVLTPYALDGNITPVFVDATSAVIDTTYTVTCTATMSSGDFLIGKFIFNVW